MAAHTPYEFRGTTELTTALLRHQTEIETWFSPQPLALERLLWQSIGASTWRGFQRLPQRPSVVGFAWISRYFTSAARQQDIRAIASQTEFEAWHARCRQSLARHWQRAMGREIPFGPSAKLVDLVMKEFVRWEGLTSTERYCLLRWLHVPLDRYSLLGIRHCFPQFRIPRSATMSSVTDPAMYRALQSAIRDLTCSAGLPPIYYDWLAWNQCH